MKRLLALFLALSFMLVGASVSWAQEPGGRIPDFADIGAKSQGMRDAIQRLAVLDILQGDGGLGGAFRPDDTLTRAEFAKIVCCMAGPESVTQAGNPGGVFTDVDDNSWYSPWVNLAAERGYFSTTLRFRPLDTVTMQEAVTAFLRLAGYDDHLGAGGADAYGDWPENYNKKAQELGLTEQVDNYEGDRAIKRGELALLANYTLDLPMVVYVQAEAAREAIRQANMKNVDRDFFATVYYLTSESTVPNQERSVIHKSFNMLTETVLFSGSASLQFSSRYYITRGLNVADLSGKSAKITYDAEGIVFVEIL